MSQCTVRNVFPLAKGKSMSGMDSPSHRDIQASTLSWLVQGENKQPNTSLEAALIWLCGKTPHLHTSPHIHTLWSYFSVLPLSWGDRMCSQKRVSGLRRRWGCSSADTEQWPADSGCALKSFGAAGFAGYLPAGWPLCKPPGYRSCLPHPHWGGPGRA